VKKLFLIIFFICISSLNAKTFKEVLHLYEFQIKTYLKKHDIDEINKVTPIKINENFKTGFWPNHWPFAAGTYKNKAFWITFKRLGVVEVHPILNPSYKNLSDINGTTDGELILTDSETNKIYILQLNNELTNYNEQYSISINSPEKISISKNNTLAILGQNKISIFIKENNMFKLKKELSKKITQSIKSKNIKDLCYDIKNNLYILVENEVLVFNKIGKKIKTIYLETKLNAFGVTYHRNLIGISSKDEHIYLFSENGSLINKKTFPAFKNKNNIKFSFFQPFAYVGLYSNLEGYAYNMGLEIKDFSWLKKNSTQEKEFSFTSTFPAKTTITISDDSDTTIMTLINNKILKAKKHSFKFNLPQNSLSKSFKLTISGKALYSQSNTKTKVIEFNNL